MTMLPLSPSPRRGRLSRYHRAIRRRLNKHLNFTTTATVNGQKVVFPQIYGACGSLGEPWMITLLQRLLGLDDGIFVDVGANLGQTLAKAKTVAPERAYVGFEPNSFCAFYINEVIRRNGFTDCTVAPVGLATRSELLKLTLPSANPGSPGGSIVPDFRTARKGGTEALVPVFAFADICAALCPTRIGVVKIDVEGAELDVLRGMMPRLGRDRPVLLLEILPVYEAANAARLERQEALEAVLAAENYCLLRVRKDADGAFAGVVAVERIGIHADLDACDYVIVPSERRAEIEAVLE